tara:strand:- start:35 stop:196 length:162 start_codon:yes stop_codon:yes gene_type:complete
VHFVELRMGRQSFFAFWGLKGVVQSFVDNPLQNGIFTAFPSAGSTCPPIFALP